MRGVLARTAAIAFTILVAFPAYAAGERPAELTQLAEAWLRLNDFQAVISGHEFDGTTHESRTFRYSYLRPNHAKLEMLDRRVA